MLSRQYLCLAGCAHWTASAQKCRLFLICTGAANFLICAEAALAVDTLGTTVCQQGTDAE